MASVTLTDVIRRATGSLGATGEHCGRRVILARITQSKTKLFFNACPTLGRAEF